MRMFRRHARRGPRRLDQGPVVYDADGAPLGVYARPRADAAASTKEGELHARLAALRQTRELDGQFRLRSQVCLFCSPPPF
jgi:hypothetical protein